MSNLALRIVGAVMLVAALVVGVVNQNLLASNVAWGEDYIADNLSAQKIVFPEAELPDGSPNEEVAASDCLTEFAGQTMSTGAQAECYANDYIGAHMRHSTEEAILISETAIAMNGGEASLAGATYATLGKFARGLDPASADNEAAAEAIAADQAMASDLRNSLKDGELLRGTLLNAYGWSVVVGIGAVVVQLLWWVVAALAIAGIGLLAASFKPAQKTRR